MLRARVALLWIGSFALGVVACAQAGKGFGNTEADSSSDASASLPLDEDAGTTTTPEKDSGGSTPDAGEPDTGTGNEAGTCTKIGNTCGVNPQCGCTSLETCDLDSAGNAGCITAGVAQQGRACASTASCARGLTCIFGTCHSFCSNAGVACGTPGTNTCYQVQLQDGGAVPNFKVCQIDCDLRDANACGGTNAAGTAACVPDGQGHTDCESGGSVVENGTCSNAARCGPGMTCVSPVGQPQNAKCKKWCRVGVNADCGGAACTGFSTKVMVGTQEYGSCP